MAELRLMGRSISPYTLKVPLFCMSGEPVPPARFNGV